MTPLTLEQVVQQPRDIGIVAEESWSKLLPAAGTAGDTESLARELILKTVLTEFQV